MLSVRCYGYFSRCSQSLISLYCRSTCCKGSTYRQVLIDGIPANFIGCALFVVMYGKAGRFGFGVCIGTGCGVFLFVNNFSEIIFIDHLTCKTIPGKLNPIIILANGTLTLRPCAALILLAACHLFIGIEGDINITLRRVRRTNATKTDIIYSYRRLYGNSALRLFAGQSERHRNIKRSRCRSIVFPIKRTFRNTEFVIIGIGKARSTIKIHFFKISRRSLPIRRRCKLNTVHIVFHGTTIIYNSHIDPLPQRNRVRTVRRSL